VHAVSQLGVQRFHHGPVLGETALPFELLGGDPDAEMRFPALAPTGVTMVFRALIEHFKMGWRKFDGKFLNNLVANGHRVSGSSFASSTPNASAMKLESKLFDNIRIKPRRTEEPRDEGPRCSWEGCTELGEYKAPKGHKAVGEYHHFCLAHVRAYNNSFNFFAGMEADEIEAALRRKPEPSGDFGLGNKAHTAGPRLRNPETRRVHDPLNIFARAAWAQSKGPAKERIKPLNEPDRRAFETMGFTAQVSSEEIRAAYKKLVKIHHPDANGGDRSSEDRLRSIIAAYTHLKTKGFVGR
jgi:hypothetical protein